MSLELFIRSTRTAVARHPCFSWAFLSKSFHRWKICYKMVTTY